MAKFFFFKTERTGSDPRTHFSLLPNQTLEDGTPVRAGDHCAGAYEIRGAYPMGTVFGTDRISDGQTHYRAGSIYPVSCTPRTVSASGKAVDETPPAAMLDAWRRYEIENKAAETADALIGGLFDGLGVSEPEPYVSETRKTKPAPKAETVREKVRRLFRRPTIKDNGFYVSERDWELLAVNILGHTSTMLTGPSGTGKTELVMEAARQMGYECCVYDMGSMHDPMTQMLGTHRIDADHKSVFDYAKFVSDVSDAPRGKAKGRIVLLDELSRAPVTTLNILFPCLDSRRSLPVEMAGETDRRSVAVHPEVVFVATANIGAEYTGTGPLDRALVNRFFPLPLTYMPAAEEAMVLQNRYDIQPADAANIVAVCNTIRNMRLKETVSSDVSTRDALQAARLVSCGFDCKSALEMAILPLFEGTDTEGERSLVRKAFMTR